MFHSKQIITASKLLRDFPLVTKELEGRSQALLVIQKSKEPLVLVNAKIYEGLLMNHMFEQKDGAEEGFEDEEMY